MVMGVLGNSSGRTTATGMGVPKSGSSLPEKMAYQCMERGLAVQMISNTKHFGMRTNGKVVQDEQKVFEYIWSICGFQKGCRQGRFI